MLYNHYKDEMYKEDAKKIMDYTRNNLCDEWGIIKVCQVVKGDLTGFKGILMRYVRRYMIDLNIPEWNDWLSDNAVHAFNNRNSIGVISSAWLTKTTEDMIMGTDDYSDEAFGTSTAVSTAFNTYTDSKTTGKYGFHTIEAENFDYLKGVYVTNGTDDNTSMISDVNADDYTAYYNVDFGNNLAKSVEIRVKANKARGKIDVRLDSIDGQQIANLSIPTNNNAWQTVTSTLINPIDSVRNIYFVYQGVALYDDIFHINSFRFTTYGLTYNDITCNEGKLSASWNGVNVDALIDNRLSTSVVGGYSAGCWIQYHSFSDVKLQGYALGSSDGDAINDPKSWQLQGSNDGEQWITLDAQTNQVFNRQQLNRYDMASNTNYTHYRLVFNDNNGGTELSLSEWQLYGYNVTQNDITADGGTLTSTSDGISALTDKNNATVFSANDLQATYKSLAKYRLKYYSLTSSNEDVSFDPKDWTLLGSNDGNVWTVIDNRIDQEFLYRGTTQVYGVTSNDDYSFYRLEVKANRGGVTTKLDEWQLFGDLLYDAFVGNITGNGGKIYSSSGNHIPALIDGLGSTTHTLSGSTNWIIFQSTCQASLYGYSITISDDLTRVPQRVVLQGSNDGVSWIQLSSSNHTYASLGQKSRINFSTKPAYRFFRMSMTKADNAVNDEITLSGVELYGLAITRQNLITSANGLTVSTDGFSGEGVDRLIDGSSTTKYCANFSTSTMINYEANEPFVVNTYAITSANDEAGRDPKTWTLEGSNDGVEWTVLDRRPNEQFYYRYDTHFYPCSSNGEAYSKYRLNISANNGTSLLQMSQLELLNLDRHETTVGLEATVLNEADIFSVYSRDKMLYLKTSESGKVSIYNTSGEVVLIDSVYEGETALDV